jgi:hypothetical protein
VLDHPLVLVLVLALAAACGAPQPPPAPDAPRPPIIDSHVHLAYWPVADQLVAQGVGAVVDLGAPEATLGAPAPPALQVIAAGPMLTHPGGYPLDA